MATTADDKPRSGNGGSPLWRLVPRQSCVIGVAVAAGILCLCTACTTTRPSSSSAKEVSAAIGRADEGVTAGPTGGAPTGARSPLDDNERRRLLDGVRQAFVSEIGASIAYTVVPKNIDAEPTVVAAMAAGPPEQRADGSTCRPIRLSATKGGQTTIGTLTFCQKPGSSELKPAANI